MGECMQKIPKINIKIISSILESLLVICFTTIIFCLIYKENITNLYVPFSNHGDVTLTLSHIKTIQEKGWYFQTDRLGAPFSSNFLDYPMADTLFYVLLKIIVVICNDPILTLNIYFYLTFITISLTTYYVLKYFKLKKILCLAGSLLFSFTPYHIIRGVNHVFLSSYYMVPLIFLICYWIYTKPFDKKKNIFSIIIIILTGMSGIYYSFFTAFFILFSNIVSVLNKKSKNVFISIKLLLILMLTIVCSASPSLIYSYQNGKNIAIASRNPNESEYYGLKMSSLFIPNSSYGISFLQKKINLYTASTYFKSENTAYLGIIGIIGFLLLLSNIFIEKNNKKNKITILLSYLTLASILLSVNFGFGSIFSYLVTAKIRAYLRISIFIEFFSLFFVLFLINEKIKNQKFIYLLGLLLIIIGIFDQTNVYRPPFQDIKNELESDKRFIEKIEKEHSNSFIFQLPYKKFPETEPINKIVDYDLLNPYIYSKTIKLTYGAMKGRIGDTWNSEINSLSTIDLINELVILDFDGIYIDRFGYLDNGQKIEDEIKKITSKDPIISENNRLSFFDLSNYKKIYLKNFSNEEVSQLKEKILYPILINLNEGCYETEKNQNQSWQWCQKQGIINIYNYSSSDKLVQIEFDLDKNIDQKNIFLKNKNGKVLDITPSKIPNHYSIEINLKSGQNKIYFNTNLNQNITPIDQRILYFQIFNLKHSAIDSNENL